jgi:D-alanyl-D-alanine carboxypeptidase
MLGRFASQAGALLAGSRRQVRRTLTWEGGTCPKAPRTLEAYRSTMVTTSKRNRTIVSFSACYAASPDRWLAARCSRTMLRLLPVLLLLAACAQQGGYYGQRGRIEYGAEGWRAPSRYYPPPGPPEDPWGPYIREAAARFNVPGHWVRAVMHQESGGEQQAVSSAGAMGLMQVMPATYEELRVRYQLGDDPYDPHNNILAGTAYIREMYDRFGAPGFLAAYNAGPDRVDAYLAGRAALPDETVNYVAAITPNLGVNVPRSGPFAVYASARSGRMQRPTVASLAAGCDVNAAYNPSYPCSSLQRAAREPAPVQTAFAPQLGVNGCDLNAAYDPNRPCTSGSSAGAAGVILASAEGTAAAADSPIRVSPVTAPPLPKPAPPPPTRSVAHGSSPPIQSASPGGRWAIQVGAFKNPGLARSMAEAARTQLPDQLRSAAIAVQPTAPFGNTVLYRARLADLSAGAASSACTHLNQRQLPCVVVPPNTY